MTPYIIIVSIIGIAALLIAVVERKRRLALRSRRLDEALFRIEGKDEA